MQSTEVASQGTGQGGRGQRVDLKEQTRYPAPRHMVNADEILLLVLLFTWLTWAMASNLAI